MTQKETYYQRNKALILQKRKEYYKKNKEILLKKAQRIL